MYRVLYRVHHVLNYMIEAGLEILLDNYAVGKSHVQLITMAIALGGHVRTGLEDVVEYQEGVPASNLMLVERVVRIAGAVGRKIATTEEASDLLRLGGK